MALNDYRDMLPDINQAIGDYDSGKFESAPTGGGDTLDNYFYGEVVISASYIRKNWTDQFIFREWVSDYSAIGGKADYRSTG